MTQTYTNRELVNLLRRLEWISPQQSLLQSFGSDPVCPVCSQTLTDGHTPRCEMARALRGWDARERVPPLLP